MRGVCCRLKMLNYQTRAVTPALLLTWPDSPRANTTSAYMVWNWYISFSIVIHLSWKYKHWLFCLFSVPPTITGQVQFPENVSVVVKNPVALNCEASGIPLPAISWLKDGQPIKMSSSVRILSGKVRFYCQGFYLLRYAYVLPKEL